MQSISLVVLTVCSVFTKIYSLPSNSLLNSRIVGGNDAKEGQFPYQASIRMRDNYHRCGGSILNNRFVLTAAHCTDGEMSVPSNMIVVVGALYPLEGGIAIDLDAIIQHPEWNIDEVANDIALVHTAEEIVFSETVQPIALPTHNVVPGTRVVMSGWGMTSVRFSLHFTISESSFCDSNGFFFNRLREMFQTFCNSLNQVLSVMRTAPTD